MTTSILFAFSLCVFLCANAVTSRPAHELESSKPSSVADSVLKRALKHTVLGSKIESARVLKQELSLKGEVPGLAKSGDGLRRAKRQVIIGNGCARGFVWFLKKCWTFESYEKLVQEMDEE